MSSREASRQRSDPAPATGQTWAWHPPLPIDTAPVFVWPPRPGAALRYLLGRGFALSPNMFFVVLALLSWYYLAPPLQRCAEFAFGWVGHLFLLNLGLTVLTAGGLHLYFHTLRRQGGAHKFEQKELDRNNSKFMFGNQVWDNMFWTCVSGVPIWTAYQAVLLWAFANDLLPWADFYSNPVWFVVVFPLLVFWGSMHFYWVHRFLHWKPVYRLAHSLHHRNVNIGPWSGIAMHPVEHLLYFSTFLVHLVIASHPIHLFFHVYHQGLSPMASHSGFADLLLKGKSTLGLGDFFHQLHHRYFDCNYGTSAMPWDRWFGSFHDGTPEATGRMRKRQVARHVRRQDSPVST